MSCDEQNVVSLLCASDLSGCGAEKSCESSVGLATADERVKTVLVNLLSTLGGLWDGSSSIPIRGITYQPTGNKMLDGLVKTSTHTRALS